MKLYNIQNNTKIQVIGDIKTPINSIPIEKNEILHFHHLDGMYSYCKNKDNQVVHLVAWADVKPIKED